jgi:phage tail sheath protein FI
MQWALFEPNTPQLWMRIKRELDVYLTQLWQEGGLKGEVPSQAFFISCDASTSPDGKIQSGRVMIEVGLALTAPAEFIVVLITHSSLGSEMA